MIDEPTNEAVDESPGGRKLRYRLLTGPDTSEFCERISAALDDGYQLYGSPTIVFDPNLGVRIAAQALLLP